MKEENSQKTAYRYLEGKKIRFGYTTGTCAAAASLAAAKMLLSKETIFQVSLMTPKKIRLFLDVKDIHIERDEEGNRTEVSCGIVKDAGDDPDVTHGMTIYATVKKRQDERVVIYGGKGIGIVTQKGLDQPVGEAAINRVPRRMIEEEIHKVWEETGEKVGLDITIFAPKGEEIAKKTFNPRIGVVGGISILGTTGIVIPMSEDALIQTIRIEMKQLSKEIDKLIITPGNYGKQFLEEYLSKEKSIQCSNYVGETLDMAVEFGIKEILFVAHLGKFIKLAGGIMNTHSRQGDCRMELLGICALLAGATTKQVKELLNKITTEDGVAFLNEIGILSDTMKIVKKRILSYIHHRTYGRVKVDVILFTNSHGRLI